MSLKQSRLWMHILQKIILKNLLTIQNCYAIIFNDLILQTVEAEITAMMPLQRTCGAESQVRNKLSNGPLRAQSTHYLLRKGVSILRRCRQTLFAGDMLVSC